MESETVSELPPVVNGEADSPVRNEKDLSKFAISSDDSGIALDDTQELNVTVGSTSSEVFVEQNTPEEATAETGNDVMAESAPVVECSDTRVAEEKPTIEKGDIFVEDSNGYDALRNEVPDVEEIPQSLPEETMETVVEPEVAVTESKDNVTDNLDESGCQADIGETEEFEEVVGTETYSETVVREETQVEVTREDVAEPDLPEINITDKTENENKTVCCEIPDVPVEIEVVEREPETELQENVPATQVVEEHTQIDTEIQPNVEEETEGSTDKPSDVPEVVTETHPEVAEVTETTKTDKPEDEQPTTEDKKEEEAEETVEEIKEETPAVEFTKGINCDDVWTALDILKTKYKLSDVAVKKCIITFSCWNLKDIMFTPNDVKKMPADDEELLFSKEDHVPEEEELMGMIEEIVSREKEIEDLLEGVLDKDRQKEEEEKQANEAEIEPVTEEPVQMSSASPNLAENPPKDDDAIKEEPQEEKDKDTDEKEPKKKKRNVFVRLMRALRKRMHRGQQPQRV